MRDHLEILREIDNQLQELILEAERKELNSEIRASSTGLELCMRSASKLLALKRNNKQVEIILGSLIKELISYCHINGLYPQLT